MHPKLVEAQAPIADGEAKHDDGQNDPTQDLKGPIKPWIRKDDGINDAIK